MRKLLPIQKNGYQNIQVYLDLFVFDIITFQMFGQEISSLTISSQVITISPEDQQGEITLTNNNKQNALLFKIKTKIQKVLEVKPSKGFLLPGQKIVIAFKAINKLNKLQCEKYQKNLQFLLQAVYRKSHEITKEQQQSLWKSIKQKKGDISLGYYAVKLGIVMSSSIESKPFIPLSSNYESRIDSKFSSNVRTQKNMFNFNQLDSQNKLSKIKDGEKDNSNLSQRYQQLKREHETLEKQREKIFSIGKTGKSNSNAKIIKIVLIFLLCFVFGNFLKTVLEPKPEPKKVQKHWFFDMFE